MPKARAASAGPKKGKAPKAHKLPERFPKGEVVLQAQPAKIKWQLGDIIGQGGFGLIYTASDVTDPCSPSSDSHVIKIEPLDNGPLFCEFHFYQRAAKPDMIQEWTRMKKLRYLGVPEFQGAGQHKKDAQHYRFLVLPRLSTDLQKLFEKSGRCFSDKTTLSVGLRMLDALEYIHDKGYCHADIKAANILLGFSKGTTDYNQVYLVDYGLAYRFLVDGAHKPYKEDPRRAHDGTAEYASRDAHKGVVPSRRGDLEILGYCMLEWLTGNLPWNSSLPNKDRVRDLKMQYMNDIPSLLKVTFGPKACPEGLKKYLAVVSKMAYDEKPNYSQLRGFLHAGISNEWTLGLTPSTATSSSRQQGLKRKSDSDSSSPRKAQRPSSSPVPSKPKAKAKTKKSSSQSAAISNGVKKPASKARPASRKKASSAESDSSGGFAAVAGSGIIPGIAGPFAMSGTTSSGTGTGTSGLSRNSSSGIIPGLAAKRRLPASKRSANTKYRSKQTAKGDASTSSSSGVEEGKGNKTSPKKTTGKSPMKKHRKKAATATDCAIQTSPGLVLRSSKSP